MCFIVISWELIDDKRVLISFMVNADIAESELRFPLNKPINFVLP